MKVSNVFDRNLAAYVQHYRYIINKGSTRSGKTYSLLQLLLMIAMKSKKPLLISVVSESMPHLKRGCIRDFNLILQAEGLYNENNINKTDMVYTIGECQIEFFSCDNPGKVHGPARDILFINECQRIPYEVFSQLNIRTRGTVFLDFNPVTKFWVDKQIMDIQPKSKWAFIHSTYKDNPFLPAEQIQAIESRKHDSDWWNVYGLGITGGRDGLVYEKYNTVLPDEYPTDFAKQWLALDFGFTNDPTALIHCGIANGELYAREVCYASGMVNQDIAKVVHESGLSHLQIIADSAEQKSIAELKRERLIIRGVKKGGGSITAGITQVKRYKLNVHAQSNNIISELDQYRWVVDADGTATNKPIDKFNHALDAIRYGVQEMAAVQTSVINRIY